MYVPRTLDLNTSVQRSPDDTLGAAFVGLLFAAILFGMNSLQMYLYYHRFPRDALLHKISVGVLWALDAFHLALITHAVYAYMITGFGNTAGMSFIIWSIKLQVLINVVIVLIVQSLYTYRVCLLGGYHQGVLGYIVAAVVAGGFAIGIVFSYLLYTIETFAGLSGISWAVDASLAASTTIDFVICIAMCHYLRKSKGSETRLNSRISTVMQYTLSSGLFTSAASLSTLFTYSLMPNSMVYLGLEFVLTKLYVGSFLAMLNARQRSEEPAQRHSKASSDLPSFHLRTPTSCTFAPGTGSPTTPLSKSRNLSIEVPKPPASNIVVTQTPHISPSSKPEYASPRW